MSKLRIYIAALKNALLDLLYPKDVICLCCDRAIAPDAQDGLCPACIEALEELEALESNERFALLKPIENLFDDIPAIKLPAFYEKLSRNGCEIYQSKIRTSLPISSRVKLYGADGGFYALGEVREYEKGSAIKTIKLFDI